MAVAANPINEWHLCSQLQSVLGRRGTKARLHQQPRPRTYLRSETAQRRGSSRCLDNLIIVHEEAG